MTSTRGGPSFNRLSTHKTQRARRGVLSRLKIFIQTRDTYRKRAVGIRDSRCGRARVIDFEVTGKARAEVDRYIG